MIYHESITLILVFGRWNVVFILFGGDCVFDLFVIVIPLIPFDIVLIDVDGLWWVGYMVIVS